MIIFAKFGDYDRRLFIEECFERYIDTMSKTKLEGELIVERDGNNKPYFKDYPNIRFSISHSNDLIVLAMSNTEVGIDIEYIKPRSFESIVEKRFFPDEKLEAQTLEGFLKVWTRKEAYLKLTSEGLKGLADADVSKPIEYNGETLVFSTLDLFDGYIGSVVAVSQPIIFVKID